MPLPTDATNTDAAAHAQATDQPVLALPAGDGIAATVDVNSSDAIKFDALGPMILNKDGTISRIANWAEMSEAERATAFRRLKQRNASRREALEQAGQQQTTTE